MANDLFPDAPQMWTLADQIAAAEREVKQRVRIYPRLVEQGKMSAEFAAQQIACMRAIVETLKQCKDRGEIATRIAGGRP